jgi:hypothetical protein
MTEPTHKLVQANSSHRFEISLLHVTSDVLGASHDFLCAGKNISIEIPGQDSPHAHCVAWRTEGHIPLEYKVEQIVLRASVEGDLSVPREALDGSFNLERFPMRKQSVLTG